jgi:hypothetical protein
MSNYKTIIPIRVFCAKGRRPLFYFCIIGVRYYFITKYENMSEVKKANMTHELYMLEHHMSLAMPRLSNFMLELDICAFQSVTNKEYNDVLKHINIG